MLQVRSERRIKYSNKCLFSHEVTKPIKIEKCVLSIPEIERSYVIDTK
jgi:hypothetical protein